ncbi:MAG: hypothetical protein KDA84_29695 [Planctomycetaceae bacterium]|nr:hypothetical protein [Planctomycetaceae bacterium]
MKRVVISAVVLVGLTLVPTEGFSDIPPVPENPSVPFKITADKRTRDNRLIIPRKFLENAGAGKVGALGSESENQTATLVAGLAISVSVVSLVFLVIRKKSRAAQALALLAALGAGGFVWMNQATADIAPPISEIPQAWRHVAKGQQNVKIEITEKGDTVELVLGTYYQRSLPPNERKPKSPPNDGASPPSEKRSQPE